MPHLIAFGVIILVASWAERSHQLLRKRNQVVSGTTNTATLTGGGAFILAAALYLLT
jgi:hypothetical protein